MPPLLEVRGLHTEFRTGAGLVRAVDGVSYTVEHGETVAIVGESGSGKSVGALSIMRLIPNPPGRITAGEILFDGVDLAKIDDAQRREIWGARIAYVAQSAAASFNPAHRLIDQYVEAPVGHQLMNDGEARRNAVDLFRRLHLPDAENFGHRYPHQVSGGQLQRAMTAMAMACHPDLIIFDEPTTALDVTTQIEVLAAIKNIVRQFHTAAIYISHDLAVVAQMADRVMVLRYGELVEEAPTRTMLSDPQQERTKAFLEAVL